MIAAALVFGGCSTGVPYADPPPAETIEAKPAADHTEVVGTPEAIRIPAIDVVGPVVDVGLTTLDKAGRTAMDVPTNARDIAWLRDIKIGEGNAQLAGHRDYKGRRGTFYNLGDLKPGDEIHIDTVEGDSVTYTVEWVKMFDANVDATELLSDQGRPVLTLITCGGTFNRATRHYEERYVVRAGLPDRELRFPTPDPVGFAV